MNSIKSIFFLVFILLGSFVTAQNTDTLSTTPDPDTTSFNQIDTTQNPPPDTSNTALVPAPALDPDTTQNNTTAPDTTTQNNTTAPDSTAQNLAAEPAPASAPKEELKDTLLISFLKHKVVQSPDSMYFNVIKLTNYHSTPVTGKLDVTVPEAWNAMPLLKNEYTVNPGETKYVPLRVALDLKSKGGIAYLISCTFESNEGQLSYGVSYVQIPKNSYWKLETEKYTVYFNQYYETVDYRIKLENNGNSDEMIKLQFEVGKLLRMAELNSEQNTQYVRLSPKSDTIITYKVSASLINEDEAAFYERQWQSSVIKVIASSDDQVQKRSVWFKKLRSNYTHISRENSIFPLTVTANLFNLLSGYTPRINVGAYGSILLKRDREIRHVTRFAYVGFDEQYAAYSLSDPRFLFFNVAYIDPKLYVALGDINKGFVDYHPIRGRGLFAQYKIDRKSQVGIKAVRNLWALSDAVSAGYSNRVTKLLSLGTAFTYENNIFNKYQAISGSVNAGYTLFKRHNIRAQINLNSIDYDLSQMSAYTPNPDTSVIGFGYKLGYSFALDRLTISANHLDFKFNKFSFNNRTQTDVSANYKLTQKSSLNFNYSKNSTITSLKPNDFYLPFSAGDMDRLLLEYVAPIRRINFRGGLLYRYSFIQNYNPSEDYVTYFVNHFYGSTARITYQISALQNIGMNIRYGLTEAWGQGTKDVYTSRDSLNLINSSQYGVFYRGKIFSLYLNYQRGAFSSLNTFSLFEEGKIAESISVRPTFEKYYFRRALRLRAYSTWFVTRPNLRENVNTTLRIDVNLANNLSIWVANNFFMSSRISEEVGLIRHKNYNLMAGIKKSFNLPHPRVKFRDLKVICFKDNNGNGERDEEEALLANILITVEQKSNTTDSVSEMPKNLGGFARTEVVTSPEGESNLYDIPEGKYTMTFVPLFAEMDLYNVNGISQEVVINGSNTTYFVPYAVSYKVKGNIVLDRDAFSDAGRVALNGIRVTAYGVNGETYSTLTSSDGSYALAVPQAGLYRVRVNNIFGPKFQAEKDEYLVDFNGFKVYNLNFKFTEKKRQINFGGEDAYQFNFGDEGDSTAVAGGGAGDASGAGGDGEGAASGTGSATEGGTTITQQAADGTEITTITSDPSSTRDPSMSGVLDVSQIKGLAFVVELGVFPNTVDARKSFQGVENVYVEVLQSGELRLSSGVLFTQKEAFDEKKRLEGLGFNNAFVKAYKDGKRITLLDATNIEEGN